jgi:hypothetical protein
MNCRTIQHELLLSESPDQPSEAVAAHLADCADCRAWQRRLVEAEQCIPLLLVPPSSRREQFLQQVRQGNVLPEPTIYPSELWLANGRPPKERGLRKLAVALALAASLALFALGWWAWPHRSATVPTLDPLVVRQLDRDQRLAQAHTPNERVQVLAELADGLHREARQLIHKADPEELRVLARFYREVVRDNLLEHARKLPRGERQVLEGVADQLNDVESEFRRLLADEGEIPAAGPLQDIAQAAREGHDQLRELIRAEMS